MPKMGWVVWLFLAVMIIYYPAQTGHAFRLFWLAMTGSVE
jgi:hypothetical protein